MDNEEVRGLRCEIVPDMSSLERIPRDHAFTWQQAAAWGVTRRELRGLIDAALVRVLFRGLFIRYDVQLDVDLRAEALAMVLPHHAVAVDETAAWLHGVDLYRGLGPEGLPRLQFFHSLPHHRLRAASVSSGSRTFTAADLCTIAGVQASTPLRTALDLARLRTGAQGLAALDGLLRLGFFSVADMLLELERFRGYRGVVQARRLVPLADPRSDSVAESWLRHAWITAGADLPPPQLQVPVPSPWSPYPWLLDLAVEDLRYAAEYDGVAYHSSPEQQQRDREKRSYLERELGWIVDVFTKKDVFARGAQPISIIRTGIYQARRRLGLPPAAHRWPSRPGAWEPESGRVRAPREW